MPTMSDGRHVCLEHSGHESDIEHLKKSEEEQWQSINRAHERIDGMKNWVIAGMSSLIIQLFLAILGVIFAYLKFKGS